MSEPYVSEVRGSWSIADPMAQPQPAYFIGKRCRVVLSNEHGEPGTVEGMVQRLTVDGEIVVMADGGPQWCWPYLEIIELGEQSRAQPEASS